MVLLMDTLHLDGESTLLGIILLPHTVWVLWVWVRSMLSCYLGPLAALHTVLLTLRWRIYYALHP